MGGEIGEMTGIFIGILVAVVVILIGIAAIVWFGMALYHRLKDGRGTDSLPPELDDWDGDEGGY